MISGYFKKMLVLGAGAYILKRINDEICTGKIKFNIPATKVSEGKIKLDLPFVKVSEEKIKLDLPVTNVSDGTGNKELDKIIEVTGYRYDPKQDIFYSTMDAWQRKFGYCRLYDEAAAPWGMIIDFESIFFNYKDKRWMIKFWKGQYDLTTGCEVGVYTTKREDLNIPGIFKGTFYDSASNEELLEISYTLKRNGKTLFKRKDRHWWLTGFILGEFCEPSELTMDIEITLKDWVMRDAYVKGLKDAKYTDNEIHIDGNKVKVKFDKPNMPQPITRSATTDWIIQRKNEWMCNVYQGVTKEFDNISDKIEAVNNQAPQIYDKVINIANFKKLLEVYGRIEKYIDLEEVL